MTSLSNFQKITVRSLGTLELETNEDYEALKKEIENLPLQSPKRQNFFIKDDQIFFKDEDEIRILISREEAMKLMEDLYTNPETAFFGRRAFMYYFEQKNIYVKGRWIEEFLNENVVHKLKKKKVKNFIVKPVITTGPMKHWQIDLIDFNTLEQMDPKNFKLNQFEFDEIKQYAKYILVVVDIFSKYVYLRGTPSKTAADVWKALFEVLKLAKKKVGVYPKRVQHDQGSEFKSVVSLELEKLGIENVFSLSHKPQSQAMVERVNLEVKDYLKQHYFLSGSRDFIHVLPFLEERLNRKWHSSIECAPIEIQKPLPDEITLPNSYSQFQEDFVKNSRVPERQIAKKYYGDLNSNWSLETMEMIVKIAHANWLILKKSADKMQKFEAYEKQIRPLLNRDLINEPLYVTISTQALYQRGLDPGKKFTASKSLLTENYTTEPTRVIRVWQDNQQNARIVTQAYPNRAFFVNEVTVVNPQTARKFQESWNSNLREQQQKLFLKK